MKVREKAVFVAQQLHFANTLAGNDPTHRARAMKKLRKYFLARANGNFSFTHDDFMRIWKGLFYCMWMSDKPLIQEELAEEISHLIHCFQHVDMALAFVQAFFDTLIVEWFGIDYHRMDKFQMFVRRFLRQSLIYCKNKTWKKVPVSGLCDVFESTVLSPSKCANECGDISLIMHFSDIFIEELAKVGSGKLPKEIMLLFLKPFITNLAEQDDSRLQHVIRDRIFYSLIKQSPEGLEYEEKFEAWKRADFPGTSWKDMVFVGKEEKRKCSGVNIKNLDPRAGKVNVYLPHLQFNAASVAFALRESSEKASNKQCQRFIRKIAHKFQELVEGRYPLALNISKTLSDSKKYQFSKQKIDDAVEDLLNFEKQLKNKDKEMKKNGKRKKNSSNLIKSKKMKLENDCADKEDYPRKENDPIDMEDALSNSEKQVEGIYHSNIPLVLEDQIKESDGILLQNGFANNHKTITNVTDEKEQIINELDEETTHGNEADNLSSTKTTKKDKKKPKLSLWNVSKISSLQEETTGIFQENKILEKELIGEIQTKMERTCEETSSQHELQDSDLVKAVKGENMSENIFPKEIHYPQDLKPQDSDMNGEARGAEEKGEEALKVASEDLEIEDQKKAITSIRRSTRRRSNMIFLSLDNNKKGMQTSTPIEVPSTPLRSSARIRTNKVPDREIPYINETIEPSNSLNYVMSNNPDSSACSSVNETSSGVSRNNDMLKKQAPSPMQKGSQTPRKKKVRLNSTPGSSKKVNIVLQMNKSQAVSDYDAALKQSPSIPYDAKKMPCKGVLKRTSMRSPMNPFYVPSEKLE